jgi:hypothetical protein
MESCEPFAERAGWKPIVFERKRLKEEIGGRCYCHDLNGSADSLVKPHYQPHSLGVNCAQKARVGGWGTSLRSHMANKRSSITMTEAEITAYLETQTILNIASIGPTGHPHLVAMWYEVMDGKVTFWTFGKSQKIVNLRRNNKITGLIESGDEYEELKGLEIVGTATIIEDYDKILAIGRAVGLKYNGEGAISDAALPFLEAQAKKRLGIQIEVENIVSWDHSKIGGGY